MINPRWWRRNPIQSEQGWLFMGVAHFPRGGPGCAMAPFPGHNSQHSPVPLAGLGDAQRSSGAAPAPLLELDKHPAHLPATAALASRTFSRILSSCSEEVLNNGIPPQLYSPASFACKHFPITKIVFLPYFAPLLTVPLWQGHGPQWKSFRRHLVGMAAFYPIVTKFPF